MFGLPSKWKRVQLSVPNVFGERMKVLIAYYSLLLSENELKRGGYEKELQEFSESISRLTES